MDSSRSLVSALLAVALAFIPAAARSQADKKKHDPVADDIMDHRTMAEAHRKAAECLESKKPDKECRDQLAKDCKGVGIGKQCGMKDRHQQSLH